MKDKEYYEEYAELILGSNKGYAFEKNDVDPVSRIKKGSKPGPRGAYGFRQPSFSELARHYENKVVEQAEQVAFFSYWPSYSALDYGQRQWYFYWRGKVRSGEYIDTDDSYIYLHAYELLAGVGWRDTEDGAQQICRLLNAYGATHPLIFQDLVIWLFDFCMLNKIPIDKEAYMDQFQYAKAEEVFSSWVSYSIAHKLRDMRAEALFRMAEVPLQPKIVEDDVLSKALVQGFVELNSFLLEKTGQDIIAGCGAYEETSIQRFAYPNALKEKQYMLQIPFIQYLKQPALTGFCREYIQIFSLQASLQKTLRNFSFQVMKPDMKRAVERICMRAIRDVKHPPLKIKVQSDNLQSIRENADIAAQRLAEAQENTTQRQQEGETVWHVERDTGNTEYFAGM